MHPLEAAARTFEALKGLIEEMDRGAPGQLPARAVNSIVDGYAQLTWALRHDDPSRLNGHELDVFAAVRDRLLCGE